MPSRHDVKKDDARKIIAKAYGQTGATLHDIEANDFEVNKITKIINGATHLRVYRAEKDSGQNAIVLIGVDGNGEMLTEDSNNILKNAAEYGIEDIIKDPLK